MSETNASKPKSSGLLGFFRRRVILSLVMLAISCGGVLGVAIAYALDHSEYVLMVAQLNDYQASVLSRVYADDDQTVIGEFYLERRIPIPYSEIPDHVRKAFIAIEDARFYDHYGVDPIRIFGAFLANVRAGGTVQGGSTITQQLAKRLFLNPEKTYSRKLKEALLAILIERYYTKEQIIELYCNQIYLGGNAYGVEAAAEYYFGKTAKELTLDEAAMLAALPKAPRDYSPIRRPHAAVQRRNHVLEKMVEEKYITREQAAEAAARPIHLSQGGRVDNVRSPYAYFVEEVRRYLEDTYGTRQTHTGGLQIFTTLNAQAQQAAVRAVRAGIHAYDRRHGWRGKLENILSQGQDLNRYRHPDWETKFQVGDFYTGLVMSVDDGAAVIRLGAYTARVTAREAPYGRSPSRLVRAGDLVICQVQSIADETEEITVALYEPPVIQGALVSLELPSGEIKAMVGGYDFNKSRFNHATQALRQTGSAFKPFIYAAAVEAGLTPEDRVWDAPLRIGDWSPSNYDNTYKGLITIAQAVAESRNIPAVRVLERVGIAKATRMIERLGLPNPMAPFLPSALGATEEPLLAMTAAYAIFATGGMRIHPHAIRRVVDREGKELERWEPPQPERVLDPYVASTVVTLMQGVVNSGTAARIRSYAEFKEWPIGGKTGTVNDFTDAWFIGYTPIVSTGVWIGFDEKKSIGNKETGSVAALPIWIDFMKEFLKDKEPKPFRSVNQMPDWIVTAREQTRKDSGGAVGVPQLPAPVVSGLSAMSANATESATAGQEVGGNGANRALPDIILKPTQVPIEPPKQKGEPDPKKKRPGKNG